MATVSNLITSYSSTLTPYSKNMERDLKNFVNRNFKSEQQIPTESPQKLEIIKKSLDDYKNIKEDTLVEPNNWKTRVGINVRKTLDIPFLHFPRGLGGAPGFTFYEYLQTAKFPFYVGGPILAALFYAGVKHDNMNAGAAAKKIAKHMAIGVGLYYVGSALARFVVNKTVKLTKGIDMNQPYAKAVPGEVNQTGAFKKSVEFHKVPESADFTRWDLLENKEGKTPEEINKRYLELAPKYGIKTDTNDVSASLKPLIKKTIIMSKAWQYALTAFYVALGIGMANQGAWDKGSPEGFKQLITKGILGKNQSLQNRMHNMKLALYDYTTKRFGESFVEFWKGSNKTTSIVGKSTILAAGISTLIAVSLLAGKNSARFHNIVNFAKKDKANEVEK